MTDNTTKSLSEVNASINTVNKTGWKRIFAFLGPAYLVSVGYMDPGNWATDIAGGSQYGYKLIWVLLMSNMIAVLLQTLSARLGIVRGLDLAQTSKSEFPKWISIQLWILAEIAIIACDLAEIVGMAIGLNLLFGIPLIWGICITAFDTILLLYLMKKGMRYMEMFIISMVAIIGVCFVLEMFIVSPVYLDVVQGFIPSSLNGNALYIAIGIIGATVMPHNLYLHSSLVQTRKLDGTIAGIKTAIKYNFIDTVIALNLAFFANAAILILAATAFYLNGYHKVAEIQDASHILEKLFGNAAPTLFAIALIAAGQSSTITGTLTGQIIMEGHLNLRIQPWLRRIITRLLAIVPALCTILFMGDSALGSLLILSQVVLSLQLGFAVIPLIHFTSNKSKMKEFAIKTWVKILAWISASIIVFLNVKLVVGQLSEWLQSAGENAFLVYGLVIPLLLMCAFLLIYVIVQPLIKKEDLERTDLPHGEALDFADGIQISYQYIGIAIDFSGNDQKIISNALFMGGKTAHYTLIHVTETAGARYYGHHTHDKETQMDEAFLNKYVETLTNKNFTANYKIGFGDPTTAIAKIVNDNNIDCLVMGAHGHKGIKDLLFGSIIDAVRHKIKVPVLIVN